MTKRNQDIGVLFLNWVVVHRYSFKYASWYLIYTLKIFFSMLEMFHKNEKGDG